MSVTVNIGENSIYSGCNTTPIQCIQCFTCKLLFHAICQGTGADAVLGSKTLVKIFLAASTMPSFKFFCDVCLTKLEINLAETEI